MIVQAFENQRSTNPTGTKIIGPVAGERTIHRLGHGHDHRGATWHEQHHRVVWLCAYRLHRSGDPEDAFPYFHHLIQTGEIWPTDEDYESLFTDQGHRFVETLPEDAQALLARARSNPGVEVVGVLGGEETAGIVIEVVDTLEETYIAFSVARMDYRRTILILAAFYPDAELAQWELVAKLPTRPLREDEAEFCYRILRG